MFVIKNYVTTGGTVACALAIGYLMQNGTPAQPDDAQAHSEVNSSQSTVIAGLEDIVLTSSTPALDKSNSSQPLQRTLQSSRSAPSDQAKCALSARARAVPGAAARLTVKAPCHTNERIEIHHSGLTVTQKTDENGKLDLTIPALSEYAIFLISVDDQTGTVATTHIPDLADYTRIALQWQGDTDLQIHALEFGASYGGTGHVSSDPATQGAGNVMHLGHSGFGDAQNIEVYSFPAGEISQTGSVELTVEAEVTDVNCGRDLNVQTLELRGDRRLRSRDLTLTLPDCAQSGEFLVLNNLLQDLTIAAN
ncbi:hypothetical protein [Ruegeria sp. Ofav3-42]|uniref:hypothetical protein n=1 Tax=Ruegeria sp. Ofav3-42 TaxID=2917759 RepID=UPI001EF3EDC1|nr:hypothetical protein [Ruegeria sp. Ofav3-42]MCG7520466.1 hypothetical protein [Ruegeria sp. Ofav3-42]